MGGKGKCPCWGEPMRLWGSLPRLLGWRRPNRGAPIRKRSAWASASSGYGGEIFHRKSLNPAMTQSERRGQERAWSFAGKGGGNAAEFGVGGNIWRTIRSGRQLTCPFMCSGSALWSGSATGVGGDSDFDCGCRADGYGSGCAFSELIGIFHRQSGDGG